MALMPGSNGLDSISQLVSDVGSIIEFNVNAV